jgi:long-chain fatty acid transport protein
MSISVRRSMLAAVASCAVVAASSAYAGGFAVREQSATAQGLSFAGAASGSGGLSSMFWNPATITMAPGWQSEWHASLILPYADIVPDATTQAQIAALGARTVPIPPPPSPLAGALGTFGPFGSSPFNSGNIGQAAIVPASYSSYQINERLWVGMYTGAPFGLGTKAEPNWAGQIYGRSARVFSFNATPTVGYKVSDWLSLGAGVQVQYLAVDLTRAVPANIGLSPLQRGALLAGGATAAQLAAISTGIAGLTAVSPLAPTGRLEADDIGFGYTLGATLTPFAGTDIGIGFRSSIRHELQGTATPALLTVVPIRAALNLPETVTVGLTQRVGAQWKVMLGYEWANWSRIKDPAVVNRIDGTITTDLPYHYRDGHFFSAGAEYQWTPQLAVRGGVAYEISPIRDNVRTVSLPDNDRFWLSIGASYRLSEKLSVDVAYSHIFVKRTPFRLVAGVNPSATAIPFVGEAKPTVDIVSAALKYRWDDTAVAIPAPLVRKY